MLAIRVVRSYVINEDHLKLVADRKVGRPSKAKADKASGTDGKVSVKGRKKKGGKKDNVGAKD